MKRVNLENLAPGMILAQDVITTNDKLLLSKGAVLTESNISSFYLNYIYNVYIEEDSIPEVITVQKASSQSQRIKQSAEFKEFKIKYEATIDSLSDKLNDIVFKNNDVLDVNDILEEPLALLSSNSNYSIFDMLHNMRSYDDSTYTHSLNVSLICGIIARWANMPEDDVQKAIVCGLLHDIGKLKIPNHIITKPGKLTEAEYTVAKNHSLEGYNILNRLPNDPYFEDIKLSALEHHERCDGTGYPLGLKGAQINKFAKIVAIADVYDAMTSARCYRGPICPFTVIDIMIADGLEKYDPELILVFFEHMGATYLHNTVRLSDGSVGEIMFVDSKYPSKPMVRLENEEYISLKETKLNIEEIL